MAKFSTGIRNAMMGSSGCKEMLTGGTLRIFSGTPPLSADDAEDGVLLMELTAGGTGTGLTFAEPSGAKLSKATGEVWMTNSTEASGTASYFRFVAAGDDPMDSGTSSIRIQGTVGEVASDMNVTDPEITSGEPWVLNHFRIGLPTQ